MASHIAKHMPLWRLVTVSSFSAVPPLFISPALPFIADSMQVSVGTVQLLILLYIFGFAISQLIYAPFATRFGRKRAFYGGVIVYILGSLLGIAAIWQDNFAVLAFSRLIVALGASSGFIISMIMVNEYIDTENVRKVLSYTFLSITLIPPIAMLVAGFLTEYLGWQSCFYFLLLAVVFVVYAMYQLPETLAPDRVKPVNLRDTFAHYKKAFQCRSLVFYSLSGGLASACIFITGGLAPFIGIKIIGLTASSYSLLYTLSAAIGLGLAAVLSGRFAKYVSAQTFMLIGQVIGITAGIFWLLTFHMNVVNPYSLYIPLFFIMGAVSFLGINGLSLATHDYPDKAHGSSVASFVFLSVPFIATLLLSTVKVVDPRLLPALILLAMLISLFTMRLAVKGK